jgi:transposase
MPWKECSVMDERLRFVARLLDGEAMSEVCRAFGISRKTGYKIFERYKEHGLEALTDRSRRPVRYANQLPRQIESLIVVAKRDKPHWGARTICELLVRRLDGDIRSGQEHDPRRAPPARPGQGPGAAAAPGDRHASLHRCCAKRALVRRFQEPAPAKAGASSSSAMAGTAFR